MKDFDTEEIKKILRKVKDPEIPSVDIVGLGIVRQIDLQNDNLIVSITPTYSGCPAMDIIESDIKKELLDSGFHNVTIEHIISPPWTTEWMEDETKDALRLAGIAPPLEVSTTDDIEKLVQLPSQKNAEKIVPCPFCSSDETTKRSEFGSTACKAIYYCNSCQQPFDYFKAF